MKSSLLSKLKIVTLLSLLAASPTLVGCTAKAGPEADQTSADAQKTIPSDPKNNPESPGLQPGDGNKSEPVCTTDRYQQPTKPVTKKLDVLFVMDTSHSMARHWDLTAQRMSKMIRALPAGTDARFSVILGNIVWRPGVLYAGPKQPKVLSTATMKEAEIIASLKKTFYWAVTNEPRDLISTGEALFYSLYVAAGKNAGEIQKQGFFRPDAALSVVLMSDDSEMGHPYPKKQFWDLPPKCDRYAHEAIRKTYYAPKGIDATSTLALLRKLKGDLPVTASAIVNITREDILVDNSLKDPCIFDSPGLGYFDIVKQSGGVLYSLQQERGKGMQMIGNLFGKQAELIHDFKLTKPASKVDPASILAKVDGSKAAHTYSSSTNVVHIANAGDFDSLITIKHCEPIPQHEWNLTQFAGEAMQTSASLSWLTREYATSGKVIYGTSANSLNDVVEESGVHNNHAVTVAGLTPNTTYYFQAISSDEFGTQKRSAVMSLHTLPAWEIGALTGQVSTTTATLSWATAAYPTVGYIRWGTSPDQLLNKSASTAALRDHLVGLEGLSPNTVYYFQAVSKDDYGMEKRSEILSLRTQIEWAVVGFAGQASRHTARLAWYTPEMQTAGVLLYGLSPNSLTGMVNDTVIGNNHAVDVGNLAAGTTYYFQAVAKDSTNREKRSAVISLRTLNDWTIANFITAPTETTISASFTTTGFPTDGKVIYGTSADALTNSVSAGANAESHEATISGLQPDSDYFLQAVAIDSLGVERSGEIVKVHTEALPLPSWSISGLEGSATVDTATILWHTSEYATKGKVLWGTSPDSLGHSVDENAAGLDHSLSVPGLQADTLYYFQVVARDDKGQEQSSAVISVRTQAMPAPVWSITAFTGVGTQTSATLSWLTNEYPTTGKVLWGTDPNNLSHSQSETAAGKTHSLTVDGLNPDTIYFFQVVANDDRGQEHSSSVIAVRTEALPLPVWEIVGFNGVSSQNSVALSFTTPGYPVVGKVRWGTAADQLSQETAVETTAGKIHTFTVDGLNPATTYYFQAVATDDRGQVKSSEVIAVRTSAIPLPVWTITAFAGASTQTSVNLTWLTSEYATKGKVIWGTAANNLSNEVEEAASGKAHALSVNGLQPDTAYFFQVVARDDKGQEQTSFIISVRTLAVPLPVWTITGVTADPAQNSITVAWNTAGYPTTGKVLWGASAGNLNNEISDSTSGTTHSVVIPGLSPDTLYYFQVVANDDRGQEKRSQVFSARTQAIPLPVWTITNVNASTTVNSATIGWATAEYATQGKVLWGTSSNNLNHEVSETSSGGTHSLTVPGLNSDTLYYFQVVATDDRGQEKRSEVFSARTAALPLPVWAITDAAAAAAVNTATVTWNTAAYLTTGKVLWGTSSGNLSNETGLTNSGTSHSLVVSGLNGSTTYYFQVVATDDRGQEKRSNVFSATTQTPAPTWNITGFDGTTTSTQANLIWQTVGKNTRATVKVGLSAGDLSFMTIDVPAYSVTHLQAVTGLSPNTTYFFQVVGFDQDGGSVTSNIISKKTKNQ